jgi:hypothetical protein
MTFCSKMTAIKPENAWFNQIQLSDCEEILLSYPANHTQGKRAVGGKLFVTNYRLAFAPNRIDANMGGETWELRLSDFASAGTDKPRIHIIEIFSGAWRTRLAIHAKGGEVQYFVVGNPQKVSGELSKAILTQAEHGDGGKASSATS